MEKKYEFVSAQLDEKTNRTLHRIRALRDFGDVMKGDLGGFIEKEENLSHRGHCWVYGDAAVYGSATVVDDAKVLGYAKVYDKASIQNLAVVRGNATVGGKARIDDYAVIEENAEVGGNVYIHGTSRISGNASIRDNAEISGTAHLYGSVRVTECANIGSTARINAPVTINGNTKISSDQGFIIIGPIGSRRGYTMFVNENSHPGCDHITVCCGCFHGTIDQFEDAVIEEHKCDSMYRGEYLKAIEYAKAVLADR